MSFFEIHRDLPREGPGSDESTRRALDLLRPLPQHPAILDLGCGPGAQTLVLARQTGGHVTAVDLHEPFLDQLRQRAREAGLEDRVTPVRQDLAHLDLPQERFDLLWAEGSAYAIGVENALRRWRPLLKPGGGLAFSEVTWLSPDPPEECRRYWDEHYPEMTDVEGNLARLADAGYTPVSHFVLPDSDWWDEYYTPLLERVEGLDEDFGTREEIEMHRKHSRHYGYVFYVAR